ncbi:GNAT family N-acetyltransferase [Salinicoccus halitifaciens]|uniref:Aminoglycoside 6'-N-acetyltransferase I n=2 Tax=Salinicoccus halitifaciens TaxID=1073415 RepID=A0ABV2EB59_9STAP
MEIMDMAKLNDSQLNQAAEILTDTLNIGYPTLKDAMEEIKELLIPENTLLAAVEGDEVLGWGGILAPEYDGNVFELHPLAVSEKHQDKGTGRAIVEALEKAAREQGGLTIWLGADDEGEEGETSLADADLYDDLPSKLAEFDPGTHQAGFYVKMGYKIIGVMPDANGPGRPDIFFGKKL